MSDFALLERPQKPSAKTKRSRRRLRLSIALPSTILLNAQKPEQRTALLGSVARYAVIFRVDEVVIFDDGDRSDGSAPFDHLGMASRILRYLDCPQYLRKRLFPLHNDLRLAGTLPPLDSPSHGRPGVWGRYRQGVVLEERHGQAGSLLDAGLPQPVVLAETLPLGARVTVEMPKDQDDRVQEIEAGLVPDDKPAQAGVYWGYRTRVATSLAKVFTESPVYDLVIGTSERGEDINGVSFDKVKASKHVLLVFGGLSGLELAVERDQDIDLEASTAGQLFDYWLNICPGQASRTIRTEEALPITLAKLEAVLEG